MKRLLIVFAIILISYVSAFSDVPILINLQGVLKDTMGAPVPNNVYALKLRIYNDSLSGSILWETNGYVPVQVTNGIFQHLLGSSNPLPDSIFKQSGLWVGISVSLDPELFPRIKLVSVPFSFKSLYADTTTTSLDKTTNASELTSGTLDTGRYSAYKDLQSEDKIGSGSDQLAAGNHTHTGLSLQSVIVRYEDTSSIDVTVPPGMTAKTLVIPSDHVNNFFRVTIPIKIWGTFGQSIKISVVANGNTIFDRDYGSNSERREVYQITCIKLSGSEWYASTQSLAPISIGDGGNDEVRLLNLNPASGLTIQIQVSSTGGNSTTATVGTLIVEYDVD